MADTTSGSAPAAKDDDDDDDDIDLFGSDDEVSGVCVCLMCVTQFPPLGDY